jgi:hypothetical protein
VAFEAIVVRDELLGWMHHRSSRQGGREYKCNDIVTSRQKEIMGLL